MNLEESDKFNQKQQRDEQKKRVVLISIVLCAILVALLLILIIFIRYQDSLQLKFYIDGTQKPISSSLFVTEDGVKYVNIREFSEFLQYQYTKGEYLKYNEDENSCYISNGIEVVAMTADEENLVKYIQVEPNSKLLSAEGPFGMQIQVKSENGRFNTFTLENPVKSINNQLYLPFDSLTDVFNVQVNTSTKNRIKIITLPNLFQSIIKIAGQLNYTNVSGIYENIRAIPYNLAVVGNNELYGVIDLSSGKEVLSMKYENLEFVQNSQEFFMSAGGTVGLLDKEGNTIIKPMDYDEIFVLDELKQLYQVKKDGKYGVLNRNGDIIVHVDYDRIGLKNIEKYGNNIEDVRNTNLLYDECVVVYIDSKYGMFDTSGKELLNTSYSDFGYVVNSKDVKGEDSVLLIPPEIGIKGLVVCYNGLYGIYDVNVKNLIVPCACTRIYSITKVGETNYYMEFNGEQMELRNYLESYDLISEESQKSKTSKKVTNDEEESTSNNNSSNNSNNTSSVSEENNKSTESETIVLEN